MARKCPPGILCITPSLIILIVGIIFVSAYLYLTYQPHQPQPTQQPIQQPIHINVERGGDDRYTRAPVPLQTYPGIQVQRTPTRGYPDPYQSMGIVTTNSGELLPLYGRRVSSRSDRFNYYTRTDTNNPIQLPINYKRKDCLDDIGCEEIFDGEQVKIVPTNQEGSVIIYRLNSLVY